MLRFYNTLTNHRDPFEPLVEGRVGLYTCGPTVYDHAHIGNFRTYVWEDLLKRYLVWRGFEVLHVMNITDVDDKTIKGAGEQGVELDDYTRPYIDAFFEDLDALRIDRADEYPRATRHVPQMVDLVKRIVEAGHTYESDGSIYFRISSFPAYGRLSGVDVNQVRPGARVDSDEYEKEDVRDFVLWKAAKEGEPSWDTEVGVGRPGWHIECSAMAMAYLGETFDIHTGGVDNIFPHHENEIAQAECGTGKPFVKTWLHSAHLIVDGEKMSKSLGNFHTLRDLLDRGADPRIIRYMLLSTHYRKPLNFTFDGLEQAGAALQRVDDMLHRLGTATPPEREDPETAEAVAAALEAFREDMDDDLNVSAGLAAVFDLVRAANAAMDEDRLGEASRLAVLQAIEDLDSVFAVFDAAGRAVHEATLTLEGGAERRVVSEAPLDDGLLEELRGREEARARKDWQAADEVRDRLAAGRGLTLEDAPDALHVRRG